MTFFESENNATMRDDEAVASDVPPRYLLFLNVAFVYLVKITEKRFKRVNIRTVNATSKSSKTYFRDIFDVFKQLDMTNSDLRKEFK